MKFRALSMRMSIPDDLNFRKLLLVMKFTTFLLVVSLLQASAAGYSQIKLSEKNTALEKVLHSISLQSGYTVFYDRQDIKGFSVNINMNNGSLEEALRNCFSGLPLQFDIRENTIFVSRKELGLAEKISSIFMKVNVRGKVVDESRQPVPGATVKLKDGSLATTTDKDGIFVLNNVDSRAVLQISFIGCVPREIPVESVKGTLVIMLRTDVSKLDQVQVVAYGTTTKRLNTGDVTTITAAEIARNPVNNVLEVLQGRVPGLEVQQATGQPGGAFTLRLRGAANFSSGAPQPLIIIDGVRYPGGTLPMSANTLFGPAGFMGGGSGLNYLNPNDIESVSVLKDADATSLYGSSGAYGVVLITTKKAKAGPASLTANIYSGVSVLGETPGLLNTEEYLMLRREALKNDGTTPGSSDKDINGTWPEDRYNDYRKEMLGSYAQNTNMNVSYSGGGTNSSYLVSGSLRNHGNIQRHNGSSRDGSLRFALNSNTRDERFNLALTGTYLSSVNDMVPADFSQAVALSAPNGPSLFLPDGSINWSEGTSSIASNFNRQYNNATNNLLANAVLTYRPVKKLTLRTSFSYNNLSSNEYIGSPTTTMAPTYSNAAAETHSLAHHYDVRNVTIEPYAEFATIIGGKGDFNFKAGGRIDNQLNSSSEIHGVGFASDALLSNPSAGTTVTTTYIKTPYRGLGAYAIMKFIWNQRYLLNLNARRDGSTKFGPGRKFGNFGSAAVAWIFSEEDFIKNNLSFLSYGKLRGSTGTVGGDAVGDFAYLSIFNSASGTYAGKTGLLPGRLANPLLSWEKNKNSEFGLELGFFKNRVYLEGNYYRNIATNQLIGLPLPGITGFGSMPVNSDATIRTSGFEMSLNTRNIETSNFSWSTSFNISVPKSKLVKLPENRVLNENYVVGKPVTGILLYKYAGINPETGYFSFTNAAGVTADYNSGLTNADKTEFLDQAPRNYGGIQNSFRYKKLSVDIFISYTNRMGRNLLSQNGFPFGYMGLSGGRFWLDRWQQPGDVTDVPKVSAKISDWGRYTNYFVNSTGAYSDASYARLQNVSLRYRFGEKSLTWFHAKDLSVYLQGQNLMTFSKFGGLDPENLKVGVIPPMRVFTAGLNVTF
ncbi:hypothetical protein DDR33_21715 [Pararcticibacter amylolyticus]|uniref:Secretin/TonB short N-terminal domain-containing protein n=2 Tax=Pararcticibacter amylolyticus TaxID=2173175 RepID=A0A2U2PB48_9SPHI|nr:hypothetical protein DDR33_21715 [Pararcticibacter amylolyticus]